MKQRSELTVRQQDELRSKLMEHASKHIDLLGQNIEGSLEKELSNGRIKSIEIIMDRVMPKLQSTEIDQTLAPPDANDIAAMRTRLLELVESDPELAKQLKAVLNGKPDLQVVNES